MSTKQKITKKEAMKLLVGSYFMTSQLENKYTIESLEEIVGKLTNEEIINQSIYEVTGYSEHATYYDIKNNNSKTSRRDKIGQFYLVGKNIYHISNGFIMLNVKL